MKIKKIAALIFSCVFFLSARGLLDNEILDIALGENVIVAASKSGVSWRAITGADTAWQSVSVEPFGASAGFNLDNIIVGDNDDFAVRLEVGAGGETISFLKKNGAVINAAFPREIWNILDGKFQDNKFFFTVGENSFAVLDGETITIQERDPIPSNITLNSDEHIVKYLGDLLLTSAYPAFGKDRLFRKNESGEFVHIYTGSIMKAVTTPDGFIYTLDNNGEFRVWDRNGRDVANRQREIIARLGELNIPPDYILNDIAVYGDNLRYSLAFASNRGIFYSPNEIAQTPFEHFYKAIPIRGGLREVYAEPGILAAHDRDRNRYATFRYALAENDRVSIDIFNYNLDFVVNIIENQPRLKGSDGVHSTNAHFDRWDGTVNNNGGRKVSPGVYFFRITTQNGKQSAFGRIVVAR